MNSVEQLYNEQRAMKVAKTFGEILEANPNLSLEEKKKLIERILNDKK
jgi:hypothetical protein